MQQVRAGRLPFESAFFGTMTVLRPVLRNAKLQASTVHDYGEEITMSQGGRATMTVLVALALSACGSVDGRYESANGGITLSLKGGKGEFAMMGEVAACTYEVKKGAVLINCAEFEGPVTLKRNDDGTLSSPFGPLTRKSS